jgi:hypothetical protein
MPGALWPRRRFQANGAEQTAGVPRGPANANVCVCILEGQ